MMVGVVMVVVDWRHLVVEHGGEVEWVRSRRCWGVMSRCLDVRYLSYFPGV